MNDVGAPQLPEQERPIPGLGRERPEEFDSQQGIEGPWRDGIDRYQPGLDAGVVLPSIEHALRLYGLTPEDAKRGGHYANAQRGFWRSTHTDGPVEGSACK